MRVCHTGVRSSSVHLAVTRLRGSVGGHAVIHVCSASSSSSVAAAVAPYSEPVSLAGGYSSAFTASLDTITRCFAHSHTADIVSALNADGSPVAVAALSQLRAMCPTGVKVALEQVLYFEERGVCDPEQSREKVRGLQKKRLV